MVTEKLKKAVCVLSGGIDSTTLLYKLVDDGYAVYALSFDYGQKHKRELNCAKTICDKLNVPLKIADLKVLNELAPSALTRDEQSVPEGYYNEENMKQTVVPNRNMVMLALATSYAISLGAKKVFYGAHSGDHAIYPDCRPEFVDAMKALIKIADWHEVELEAPFIDMDKGDIARLGMKLGVDYNDTWTCYKGGETPCGKCGSCVERLEAFQKVTMADTVNK